MCQGWRVRACTTVFPRWSGEVCAEGGVCEGGLCTWKVCVEGFAENHTCVSSSALFIWKCLHLTQQFTSHHASFILKWTFPYHRRSPSLPYVSLTLSCLIRHTNGIAKRLCAPVKGKYKLINTADIVGTCMATNPLFCLHFPPVCVHDLSSLKQTEKKEQKLVLF